LNQALNEASPVSIKASLGEVFFILSICTFLVFFVLLVLIRERQQILNQSYANIEKNGDKVFSVLKDHFIKYQKNKRQDVYTYNIPDETGNMLEVSEAVDKNTHLRLRVGDTVECYRQVIKLAGKKIVISRIKGNLEPPTNYIYLYNFSLVGIGFSGILFFLSIFYFMKEKVFY
jgi:hypothetical protein